MLNKKTQPLRDEHAKLLIHIESLRRAGDALTEGMLSYEVQQKMDEAYEFLISMLLPHAEAEEKVLYPVIQKVMGSPLATDTMIHDHKEIASLTQQLVMQRSQILSPVLSKEASNSLRRVLYGLYTLVKMHFVKEEEIYLPLLDLHLKDDEAASLFADLEEAGREKQAQPQA
jgi:iron-sulfur cluster repair protein YtfE (RIC family)